ESGAQSLTITVIPTRRASDLTKGANQTVNEDAGAQTVVGWATAISKGGGSDESSQVLSFVFTGNDNPGLFLAGPAIDASGALSYTRGANANAAANYRVKMPDN